MLRDYLEKRLAEIKTRIEAATEVEEVRRLNAEADEIRTELAKDSANAATTVNGNIVNGHVRQATAMQTTEARDEDPTARMEYRRAFMAYVQRGTEIPAELRNGDVTNTGNAGAVIPVTVMDEVINTIRKRYGNLYGKVRKITIPGGVEFPVGALSGTFKWISEAAVSPRQKIGSVAKVSFNYHTAEIRLAQTFVSALVSIPAFEAKFAEVIAIAYLEAMDQAIVNGSGVGQPLGILNDARVTNTITMTAADMGDWTAWRKKLFAKLPLGYRNGEFIFPMSTVESHLLTMADSNNRPIFRESTGLEVYDGDAAAPYGWFFGRAVSLVEPDIIGDFDTANANDVIGIYWQPEEYAINENFGFTVRRYFDEETNEWIDKAIVVVDGKVLNPTGYYLIKKGS